ncbi:hypothetical protein [Streptomyces sp. KL116D]|uniref:hypothetical protein n=1 Tax=Streptomyces sp. KL116D TaxID=3045152 RepID=UPI0035563FF1
MSGPGSLLDETLLRLKDTGLYVRDIEFLTLDERVSRERWLPILETVARLGATHLSVVGADPDRARLADSLAALTRDAAPYGLVPTLEPITYQPVHSIPEPPTSPVPRAAPSCSTPCTSTGSAAPSTNCGRWSGRWCPTSSCATPRSPSRTTCPAPRASRSVSPPTAVTSSWSHERCARCRGGRTAARRLPGRGAGGYAGECRGAVGVPRRTAGSAGVRAGGRAPGRTRCWPRPEC